jgi:hypothetical protein
MKPTIVNKPLLAAVLAVVATCPVSPSLYASEPQTAADQETAAAAQMPGAPAAAPVFPTPEEVVNILEAKLSLSAEQKSSITPIIASRQEKLKAVMADTSVRRMKRGRELRDIVTESDKQINALLTPAQQKQYAEIEKQMREQMKQRMQERRNAGAG